MPTSDDIERGFAEILKAALTDKRCPTMKSPGNPTGTLRSGITNILLAQGRIKVEVYAHNYRVIEITTGLFSGKRTRAPDNKRWRPYKILPRVAT